MNHIPIYTYQRDHFTVSTDSTLLDLDVIHGYLYHAYWCPGIPRDRVAQALLHSFNFGLYDGAQQGAAQQIGLARVITDYTSFAYLCDVFVLKSHRELGLGTWLIDCVVNCPALVGIRSFFLATRDAHGLYEKFGFARVSTPDRLMVKAFAMPWRDEGLTEE
jgi:GNAT superfamily N-acetyltransferase